MPETGASRLMIIGRGLTLLLLLAGVFLPYHADWSNGAHVVVLVDVSDQFASDSTAEATEKLVANLESFDERLDFDVFKYGTADVDGTAAIALEKALWRLETGYKNSIVLVSPGHWRSEIRALLEETTSAGIPVYWLQSEPGLVTPRITGIEAPTRGRSGQRIRVGVDVDLPAAGHFAVELHTSDGAIGRQTVAGNGRALFPVDVQANGVIRLDAKLVDSDTGRTLDELRAGASVNVLSAPKLLIITGGYSPIAASLVAGGWPVTQIRPSDFAALANPLPDFSALIMDNVATTDLPDSSWAEIANAVRRNAVGMLVLGGPNSFGLGAYRGSVLEDVLPVISEPPEDETPASVVFLVDVSGSMGRQPGGKEGLRAARDAVLFSAAALRPADRVGLIVFDVEARQLLPTIQREDHLAAIGSAWPNQASGGTSVVPALDLAQAALARETAEQKLMILVTDGMLSPEDLEALQSRLASDDFEFVAMILAGGQADVPLLRKELGERASMLVVDDVLRLPTLMRNEVETSRSAIVFDRTAPVQASPPPMLSQAADWPALDSYLVTRARPDATVVLQSERGEPLLAFWTAGTGRVAALTGGLNLWAAEWQVWDRWPELVTSLVNFVAVTDSGLIRPGIEHDSSGQSSIVVETGMTLELPVSLSAQLVPPAGPPLTVSLAPDAPGRYRAPLNTDQVGVFTLVWESENSIQRHSLVNKTNRPRQRTREPLANKLVTDGLLETWSEDSTAQMVQPLPFRSILIAIALMLLIATVALERVPLSRLWKDSLPTRK